MCTAPGWGHVEGFSRGFSEGRCQYGRTMGLRQGDVLLGPTPAVREWDLGRAVVSPHEEASPPLLPPWRVEEKDPGHSEPLPTLWVAQEEPPRPPSTAHGFTQERSLWGRAPTQSQRAHEPPEFLQAWALGCFAAERSLFPSTQQTLCCPDFCRHKTR